MWRFFGIIPEVSNCYRRRVGARKKWLYAVVSWPPCACGHFDLAKLMPGWFTLDECAQDARQSRYTNRLAYWIIRVANGMRSYVVNWIGELHVLLWDPTNLGWVTFCCLAGGRGHAQRRREGRLMETMAIRSEFNLLGETCTSSLLFRGGARYYCTRAG